MYENETYDALLERMISRALSARPGIDSREGSLLWLAHAPAAAELVNVYIALEAILSETFADTASRDFLILRASERGIVPREAEPAHLEVYITPGELSLPKGARFSIGDFNYVLTGERGGGYWEIECETAGEAGTSPAGDVIPIEYIDGLLSCRVTGVIIPGRDEEPTESIRARYMKSLKESPFGGNRADYREKIGALPGVGGVKVYRAWNAGLSPASFVPPEGTEEWISAQGAPEDIAHWLRAVYGASSEGLLTVGGTVRVVIIGSEYASPSEALLNSVQMAVDPKEGSGEGLGLAPIGHVVTVEGVGERAVSAGVRVQLSDGFVWEDVREYAENAVKAYFRSLCEGWADSDEPLTVRVSQIETRLLSIEGIVDVTSCEINGAGENLTLGADEIPVFGGLYLI
ncbi:MAG: baseplate J/gp47 family protein [Clostridia bacterium]|nr:baseplate J/gp47 family protein [Clostridia bacterium]